MLAREDYDFRLLGGQNLLFLCDNVGSGKTISILSLISERPQVKSVWKNQYYLPKEKLSKYDQEKYKMKGLNFSKDLNVFNSNLVIIPHNIYVQWDKYIGDNTSLKYYSIGTKKQINLSKDEYDTILNENEIICIKSTMVKEFVNKLDSLYGQTTWTDEKEINLEISTKSCTVENIIEEIKKESKTFINAFTVNPSSAIMNNLLLKLKNLSDSINYKHIQETANIKMCDDFINIVPVFAQENNKSGYMFQRVINILNNLIISM